MTKHTVPPAKTSARVNDSIYPSPLCVATERYVAQFLDLKRQFEAKAAELHKAYLVETNRARSQLERTGQ